MQEFHNVPIESILRNLVAHPTRNRSVEILKKGVISLTNKNNTFTTTRMEFSRSILDWAEKNKNKKRFWDSRFTELAQLIDSGNWDKFLFIADLPALWHIFDYAYDKAKENSRG